MNRFIVWVVLLLFFSSVTRGWSGPPPSVTTATVWATTEPLRAFGYEVFQGLVREITEGPVEEDYVVGPRDQLLIQTWGEYTKQYPVTVGDNGDFYLDAEGQRFFVNGLTLRQVQQEVFRRFSQIHEGYFNWQKPTESKSWVDIRAILVRPLIVYVAGEAFRPGTLQLSSTVASLINVLTLAGGIKPTGSLRRILISRADGKTEKIDLYDFLIRGDTKPVKARLKYGETIFVDLKRKSVSIRGHVRRAGIYEMLDSESLRDLLDYAGGPIPGAYLKRVQIVRRAINEGTRTVDVDFAALDDKGTTFPLLDGDSVEIFPSVEEDYVASIEGGGIYRKGTFQFAEGMTLADLIEKGEGLRSEVYLDKADLIRTRKDYAKEYRSFSLKELYRLNPQTGKVELIAEKTSPLNFPLQRLDRIMIYSTYEMKGGDKKVRLEGHVKVAGEHLLAQNMKLADLLFAYGGFDDRDWRRATYLERADLIRTRPEDLSTTIIAIALRRILEGNPQADMPLESMDRIIVYSYDEIVKKDKFVRLDGHVKKPGEHPLSENMRLSDLLFAYGGFEDVDFKKATFMERADLYRTNPNDLSVFVIPVHLGKVLAGDRGADLFLQSLDQVVVYEYKQFYPDAYFTIAGAVRNPGQYQLATNTTLNDAIVMASGLLDEAYKYEAEIVRRLPKNVSVQEPAEVIRVPISENYASEPREKGLRLLKDDAVFIRTVPGWEKPRLVQIRGEVQFPGEYALAKAEERLSDLVRRAGGPKETAYLPGAVFTRLLGEESELGERVRIAIDLKRGLAKPGSPSDPILRDGDEIRVPINPMTVEVRGAVQVPAILQYQKGRSVSHYISLCGGFTKTALRSQVLLLNPDGTTRCRGWGWFQPEPLPGSVIIVPPPLPGGIQAEEIAVSLPAAWKAPMAHPLAPIKIVPTLPAAALPTTATAAITTATRTIIRPPVAFRTTETLEALTPGVRPFLPSKLPIP